MRLRSLRLLGLGAMGPLCLALFACSGSTFTSKSSPREAGNDLPGEGGASGEGGSAMAGTQPPQEPETNGAGGNGAGGKISSGEAAGSGGSVTPPDAGMAGEPNVPELPPEADCDSPVYDTWEAPLGSSHSSWKVEFGDPRVDLATERLIVSYDDVAARKTPLAGGYYLTAEVTFEGYTVLTPYPYVSDVLLPSLRRSAAGSGIELGSTMYGQSNVWHDDQPAGFAGNTLNGTTKVLVTLYIQASSQALAVKVQSGEQIHRSGWLTDFTWPDTDLSRFRYVGENNSAVYRGASDVVYVGTVEGCQGLSDAAVAQHYDD